MLGNYDKKAIEPYLIAYMYAYGLGLLVAYACA